MRRENGASCMSKSVESTKNVKRTIPLNSYFLIKNSWDCLLPREVIVLP